MEKVLASEKKGVITVLTEGKKQANELKRQLHPTTASREACGVLLESILSSYENAITLLSLIGDGGPSQLAVGKVLDPSIEIKGSPRSEGSEQNSKKRKTMPRWSEHVRVCEAQLEDGYNWRKYGQKVILGTNHPRAYYRCTHRNTQGCLATKQVQRADEDPTTLDVIYRGKHSCRQERLKQNMERKEGETTTIIKTENRELVPDSKEEDLPSFSFPSTPIQYEGVEPQFFPEPSVFVVPTSSYSPSFLSPANSDSYFSLNDFGICQSLQSPESDFGEIISNPTSMTDFSLGDLDMISIDAMDFESHFLDALDDF